MMGRSFTYHVIGYSRPEGAREYVYPAMNRLEMEQETRKAFIRDGRVIVRWEAQTRTGTRILGGKEIIPATDAPKVKTVQCPKCTGTGCSICNFSGITTARWLKGFRAWQLTPDTKGA
jgi:hypothetical protein